MKKENSSLKPIKRSKPNLMVDISDRKHFISSDWGRNHFMKFVYLLMFVIIIVMQAIGYNSFIPQYYNLLSDNAVIAHLISFILILIAFLVHELIHILFIFNKGDISITFNQWYFWINTNSELSKLRFWLFMSAPFIILSVIPIAFSAFIDYKIKPVILFIAFINLIISSSDLINSFLILIKPNKSVFCRGYYKTLEELK